MDFGLSEEQQQLKSGAREFLRNECSTAVVRKAMADPEGMPRELYRKMAELGWNGLMIPEQFGGLGLGMLDMAILLAEGGYAAMPGPLLFSSMPAAGALSLGGSEDINGDGFPRSPTEAQSVRWRLSKKTTVCRPPTSRQALEEMAPATC